MAKFEQAVTSNNHCFTQVRLNFMSTLLDEAYGYLHSFLTASILNIKLFRQPFHRDVALTVERVAAMRASMAYCQQVRIFLVLQQICQAV